MLAAVRSTSCHAGGKPTGYVSLMDKKGEKGEKKRGAGSESARTEIVSKLRITRQRQSVSCPGLFEDYGKNLVS